MWHFLDFYIAILIFIGAIITVLNSIKEVKPFEAYVIERFCKFNRVIEDNKKVFIIPFIDKVKYVVDLNEQTIKCLEYPIVLSDNILMYFKNTIYFRVVDV